MSWRDSHARLALFGLAIKKIKQRLELESIKGGLDFARAAPQKPSLIRSLKLVVVI